LFSNATSRHIGIKARLVPLGDFSLHTPSEPIWTSKLIVGFGPRVAQ
jgi:hypothetical protein